MTTAAAPKPVWAKRPSRNQPASATAADPIDDLIRKQSERASGEESVGTTPAAAKAPARKISLNIDEALHKRLKHYCVIHDTNVSELLGEIAEKFLAENA